MKSDILKLQKDINDKKKIGVKCENSELKIKNLSLNEIIKTSGFDVMECSADKLCIMPIVRTEYNCSAVVETMVPNNFSIKLDHYGWSYDGSRDLFTLELWIDTSYSNPITPNYISLVSQVEFVFNNNVVFLTLPSSESLTRVGFTDQWYYKKEMYPIVSDAYSSLPISLNYNITLKDSINHRALTGTIPFYTA